jgi:large subunit ribosomal protein L18
MKKTDPRQLGRTRRHRRVRKKISGSPERPRLSVFRSNKHIYAQIIDDRAGRTMVSASSMEQGLEKVVFERGGNLYHGRVKALADGAREGGLVF